MNNGTDAPAPLLRVRGLRKVYRTRRPGWRRRYDEFVAVAGATFDVGRGETLGVVGESGSGKTTLARCALRAIAPTAGTVEFRDPADRADEPPVDLATLPERDLLPLRRRLQMIFQDPYSSLNPRMTVEELLTEPLMVHRACPRAERRARASDMLVRVGLSADHLDRYPHAFSGGQRQRIGIARALILKPAFVVADEATSALDVTVRAQVLRLLAEFQRDMGLTYLFVSHDLSVVREACDRVLVMYRGRVVEAGRTAAIFDDPQHPYTRVLLSAIPDTDPDRKLRPLSTAEFSDADLEPLADVDAAALLA